MSYVFKQMKRNAELIMSVLFFVSALFSLLTYVGTFPDAFMPVIGHLLSMLLRMGILISIPSLLILKKKDLSKNVFTIFGSFWLIACVFSDLGNSQFIRSGFHGLRITISVFELLIACALLTAIVFFVIGKIKEDVRYSNVSALIMLGAYAAFFVTFALNVAYNVVNKVVWTAYVADINECLVLPAAMFFGTIVFGILKVAFPEKPIIIPEESGEDKVDDATSPEGEDAENDDDNPYFSQGSYGGDVIAEADEEGASQPEEAGETL